MKHFFEAKVKYINEDGKKKSEIFLIDSTSCTEGEAIATGKLKELAEQFEIPAIKESNICDVVATDGEWYYKGKISIVTLDEASGKEKKSNQYILVAAEDFKHALELIEDTFETCIVPWELTDLKKSNIVEFVEHKG